MGKRSGPRPAGLIKLSARLSSSLVEALTASALKRKRNMSREIEHRLNRSMIDDRDDERTYALLRLLRSVLRSTMGRKMSTWLDDPHAFDQAVIAINTTLELIRPKSTIDAPAAGDGLHGALAAHGTLADIQKSPTIAPANASAYRREMTMLRQAIGDVVDRAMIHGKTAEQLRADEPARLELVALRKKDAYATWRNGPVLTNDETKRMKILIARLVTLAHYVTIADDGDNKIVA
jgi:hypothetical protein